MDLLERVAVSKPPVDVERIARSLRYDVVFEHFPGDLSGTLIRDEDGSMTIGINSYHPLVRQRFSIAHEIGHAQLHIRSAAKSLVFVDPPGPQMLFRDGKSALGEDPLEIQANQFAAGLLMPSDFIRAIGRGYVERFPTVSVDQLVGMLSERFEVSSTAMRFRLVTLGLLQPD